MIGVVVATHGEFGSVLLDTLKGILGEAEGMSSVDLMPTDSLEIFQEKLEKAVSQADPGGMGVLVLVDMLGGTPFNVAIRLAQAGKIQVVTGVNLPMLITAASHRGTGDLSDLAREVQVSTRGAIVTSVELFQKNQ